MGTGSIGDITRRSQEACVEATRGRTARGSHWRLPAYRETGVHSTT